MKIINIFFAPKIEFKKSVQDSLSNFGKPGSLSYRLIRIVSCLFLVVGSSFTVIFHLVSVNGLFFAFTWKHRAVLAPIKLVFFRKFRVDSVSVEFHSCASLFKDFRLYAHSKMSSKTTSNADNVEQEHLEHYETTRERYKGSCLFLSRFP